MKKIRIGNDIVIKWRITINGEEVNIEGLDFSQFHSTTQTDKDGRIVKGRMATSALPPLKPSGYYSGVFCLNQPLEVPITQDGTSAPKNKYYPYWVVSNGVITEQGNYYFAP